MKSHNLGAIFFNFKIKFSISSINLTFIVFRVIKVGFKLSKRIIKYQLKINVQMLLEMKHQTYLSLLDFHEKEAEDQRN